MRMSEPNEAREALKVRSRSPYILWLMWIIWLPALIQAVMALTQAHPTLPRFIITCICLALFVGFYLWGTWNNAKYYLTQSPSSSRTSASDWLSITFLIMLSLVLVLMNGKAWLGLFYFISGYMSGRLPTVRALQSTVVFVILIVAVGVLIHISQPDIMQTLFMVCVISVLSATIRHSIMTSQELGVAREEITRLAVTAERLRIARDLHDLLGHNLSLIALKSELAGRVIETLPERAAAEIHDVEQVARTTLQEVREAVASYRQPTLAAELQAAQEILTAAGIAYYYDSDEKAVSSLLPTVETLLSWTVREGVTNVIRHSRAHQCTIRIMQDKQHICVEVVDDGKVSSGRAVNEGNGLRGLAERVASLGGQFSASSRADGGFLLAITIPHTQKNDAVEVSHTLTTPRAEYAGRSIEKG